MNNKRIYFGLIATAVEVGVIIYNHIKLQRTINALDRTVDVVNDIYEHVIQKEVDEKFVEIVETFDD